MKIKQLLSELKIETEDYLQENVIKKGKKYYVVKKSDNKQILPGTKEDGYLSVDNAVKSMLSASSKNFDILPFTKKQEKINKFIEKWRKENNISEPKTKKRYGFEIN